jgi:outer membrane biosynthesis protein TonB
MTIKSALAILALSGAFFAQAHAKKIHADIQLTHITPSKENAVWARKKQTSPIYPIDLARNGIEGCGIFKVQISETGQTKNIELVSSIPSKKIFKASKKIIKKLKWQETKHGISKAQEKVIRLDYCIGGESFQEVQKRCIEQTKLSCTS